MAATAYASRRVGAEPSINASVAVGYDQPGHAISENFIGLSYKSAVLASPEHLSPGNLSIMGLLRGLGPGGVLRLGGNSSARVVRRDTAIGLRSRTSSSRRPAIDALAALSLMRSIGDSSRAQPRARKPEAAVEEAAYVAQPRGRVCSSPFRSATSPTAFGVGPACARRLRLQRLFGRVAEILHSDTCTTSHGPFCRSRYCCRAKLDTTIHPGRRR